MSVEDRGKFSPSTYNCEREEVISPNEIEVLFPDEEWRDDGQ
jgi:hypothetical protein